VALDRRKINILYPIVCPFLTEVSLKPKEAVIAVQGVFKPPIFVYSLLGVQCTHKSLLNDT
jgi:hypothetical protein